MAGSIPVMGTNLNLIVMKIPVCAQCGSSNVVVDANAEWDAEKGEWVVRDIFEDDFYCCDEEEDIGSCINWDEIPEITYFNLQEDENGGNIATIGVKSDVEFKIKVANACVKHFDQGDVYVVDGVVMDDYINESGGLKILLSSNEFLDIIVQKTEIQ